ncbi:hypothetical protein QAD02_023307 [Eretmocerus hayati]|uniref:Uncharacterized protein n=1 Tax=Eretmocerus hayati TaxID=131215 RepID=A0ACC2PWL2_9HYME|nr:hypothetical protein QAD02_023307 [Eretmocerus hayati]
MASPRATYSILRCLSPQKGPNLPNRSLKLSPKVSEKSLLSTKWIGGSQNPHPVLSVDTPNRKKIINEGDFGKSHRILGNGAFGTVYEACYKGKAVAAKMIDHYRRRKSLSSMERDMAFLRHSNIVKILRVDEGPAMTLITMELCGESLQDLIEENPISKDQKVHIWMSIAHALDYCHKMGIVHSDVKPKNVLMSEDNQPKLADFGSAIFMREPFNSSIFHGTPGYTAPEVVRNNTPTPQSDVYSLAVLAWQMLSRKPPFYGLHKHAILYLTGKGQTPPDSDFDDEFNGKYKWLYSKNWSKKPQDRLDLTTTIQYLESLQKEIS